MIQTLMLMAMSSSIHTVMVAANITVMKVGVVTTTQTNSIPVRCAVPVAVVNRKMRMMVMMVTITMMEAMMAVMTVMMMELHLNQ